MWPGRFFCSFVCLFFLKEILKEFTSSFFNISSNQYLIITQSQSKGIQAQRIMGEEADVTWRTLRAFLDKHQYKSKLVPDEIRTSRTLLKNWLKENTL